MPETAANLRRGLSSTSYECGDRPGMRADFAPQSLRNSIFAFHLACDQPSPKSQRIVEQQGTLTGGWPMQQVALKKK